ncbi:MAG TPA: 1-acyl-sn-glycerol-3-phosphate acyltransferase [Bacteroidia bacterium]|jgi:glycerol-3-phosphate O-acyltransferase/dihydroxyacetone phosphate acyltransferase|nr:1-acyl-sn-glycerol-3-phosphate acyltransferase [Bacteroidia bacterium]
MLWYFLRNTLFYCFHLFFKRQKIKGSEHIRQKGPMFIAMNHPNAFMDPIAFATFLFYPRTYYMARGDAFKKGLVTVLLESMGIVPIYRLRDGGYETVKKNLDSFKITYKLLDKGKKIMVFAEGLSIKERRLRPIQKGTAKMSFGYLEQGGDQELKILPVGINYSEPEKFRSYVFFNIGEPILVKDFYEDYKVQPAIAINKLTALLEERMRPLVPSLKHKENDLVIEQLQEILKKQFIDVRKLNYNSPEDQQKYWDFIIERLNKLTEEKPQEVESFRKEVDFYYKQIHELKLRDHLIYRAAKNESLLNFANIFLLILGFPVYLVGKFLNFVPYYLAQRITAKKVKDIEFKASVLFGTGAILLNILFLIELLIVWLIFRNWKALLIFAAIKGLCGIFGLNYSAFKKKMLGTFRLKGIKKSNPSLFQSLLAQRAKILDFAGDFH